MIKKMIKCTGWIITAISLATGSSANASTRTCRVKPTNVTTDLSGNVYISGLVGANGNVGTTYWAWQLVCNLSTIQNSVQTQACTSWLSTALTAQAQGKTIFIYFDDVHNNGQTDCSLFPAWGAVQLLYLGIEN